MKHAVKLVAGLAVLAALAGCETSGDGGGYGPPAGNAPEEAGRQACLRDVKSTTGNYDAVVLSSSFSQAGTEVIVGVGPQRAQWRCIAYSDGTTTGITSLTNEGAL